MGQAIDRPGALPTFCRGHVALKVTLVPCNALRRARSNGAESAVNLPLGSWAQIYHGPCRQRPTARTGQAGAGFIYSHTQAKQQQLTALDESRRTASSPLSPPTRPRTRTSKYTHTHASPRRPCSNVILRCLQGIPRQLVSDPADRVHRIHESRAFLVPP